MNQDSKEQLIKTYLKEKRIDVEKSAKEGFFNKTIHVEFITAKTNLRNFLLNEKDPELFKKQKEDFQKLKTNIQFLDQEISKLQEKRKELITTKDKIPEYYEKEGDKILRQVEKDYF